MTKKVISIVLMLTLVLGCCSAAFAGESADSESQNANATIQSGVSTETTTTNNTTEPSMSDSEVSTKAIPTVTGWDIVDKDKLADTYSSWDYLGKCVGPGYLYKKYESSGSNTISGSLKVAIKAISASLGFEYKKSWSKADTYKMGPVPKGETWQMKVRKRYENHRLTQQRYVIYMNKKTYLTGSDDIKKIKVKTFDDYEWDYDVK